MTNPAVHLQETRDTLDLSGRVALVTGGAGGLGSAIATRMAAAGASVFRTDRENRADGSLPVSALDVTSREAWAQTVGEITNRHGRLDILVHAAGFYQPNIPFEALTLDLWKRHFETNLESAFLGCQTVLPLMEIAGSGSIVLFSSTLARQATALSLAYSCAKAGVETLTRALAKYGGPKGIRVNAVAPGPIDTAMLRGNIAEGSTAEELFEILRTRVPLGRMGMPDDAASLAHFLCSDAGAFISGAVIPLDGGQVA